MRYVSCYGELYKLSNKAYLKLLTTLTIKKDFDVEREGVFMGNVVDITNASNASFELDYELKKLKTKRVTLEFYTAVVVSLINGVTQDFCFPDSFEEDVKDCFLKRLPGQDAARKLLKDYDCPIDEEQTDAI